MSKVLVKWDGHGTRVLTGDDLDVIDEPLVWDEDNDHLLEVDQKVAEVLGDADPDFRLPTDAESQAFDANRNAKQTSSPLREAPAEVEGSTDDSSRDFTLEP